MKKEYAVFFFLLIAVLVFLNSTIPPLRLFNFSIQSFFSAPKSFLYSLRIIGTDEGQQIKALKSENNNLKKKLADYYRIKSDNDALMSQFQTTSITPAKLMPAKVIGFTGQFLSPYSLVINKGKVDGILSGMAVLSGNNLVGKINHVSEKYSEVLLENSPTFTSLGKTAAGGVLGVIKGQGDFILLQGVSTGDKITKGETVLTKGEINEHGIGIPQDLVIGRVSSVYKSESLPFQTAKIESALSFYKLLDVFILKEL